MLLNIFNLTTFTTMTEGSKRAFEKAYNRLSDIISNIDNFNKDIIKDRLQLVQQDLENVDEYFECYRKL